MEKRVSITIILTCVFLSITAQYNRVYLKLPHPDATGVLQDKSGLIWISTFGGLCQYNGADIVKYTNPYFNQNRGLSNRIIDFESVNSSLIWMMTDDGVHCFDKSQSSFVEITFSDQNEYRVYPLAIHYIDQSNILALLYKHQIRLYDFDDISTTLTLIQTIDVEEEVFASEQNDLGNLWLTTSSAIYKLSEIKNGTFALNQKHVETNSSIATPIHGFDIIENDSIAILYSDKLIILNDSIQYHSIPLDLPGLNIQNIQDLEVAKHQIHIASMDNYICLDINNSNQISYNQDAKNIRTSNVNNIFLVDNAIAWMSCYGNGILYQSTNQIQQESGKYSFTNPKEIFNKYVRGLAIDNEDNLWIGTNEDGLYKYNLETYDITSFKHFSKDNLTHNTSKVRSICIDSQDRIFVGTQTGLSFSKDKGQSFERLNLIGDETENQFFFSIIEDKYGYLWVGSFRNGLIRLNVGTHSIISTEYITTSTSPAISSNEISYLHFNEEKNEIWASSKKGINKITLSESGQIQNIEHIFLSDILPNQGFSDFSWPIEVSDKDTVWVGTIGSGLVKLWQEKNGYQTQVFDISTGLPSNDIEVMHYDHKDHLWIGSNGLTKLNIRTGELIVFNKADGLSNDFFRVGSSYRSPDSTLYFGGTNGLDVFKTGDFLVKNTDAKIRLDELDVNYKIVTPYDDTNILSETINSTASIELEYNENNLSIAFSSLNYQNQNSDTYEYQLEQYDTGYKQTTSTNRVASYSKLPAGKYVFKVRSINRNGDKSPFKELNISISPAPWLSNFAKLIYLITGLFILYWIYNYYKSWYDLKKAYTKELERSNEDLEREVSLKTASLTNTISELNRSYQDLEKFAATATHDLKEPLRTIGSYVQLIDKKYGHEIDDKGREYMTFVSSGVNRMTLLINKLLEFSKIGNTTLKLEQVELNTLVKDQLKDMQLYIEERKAIVVTEQLGKMNCDRDLMGLVFFNLIHNGIKYNESEQPKIKISAEHSKGQDVIIRVTDNGIGIPDEDKEKVFDSFYRAHNKSQYTGSGIGLSTVMRIIEKHNGEISIESSDHQGTTVVMSI